MTHPGTYVMLTSQSIAWALVISVSSEVLYLTIGGIALFYCIWALVNKYMRGVDKEIGQYTTGILTISSFLGSKPFSIFGCVLVNINFALALAMFVLPLSVDELAKKAKKDIIWAYALKAYFLSSQIFWCFVLYKLIQLEN